MKPKATERLDRTGHLVVQGLGRSSALRRHWTDGSGRGLCGAPVGLLLTEVKGLTPGPECKRCERSLLEDAA
jgi:hypothetical protein